MQDNHHLLTYCWKDEVVKIPELNYLEAAIALMEEPQIFHHEWKKAKMWHVEILLQI